MNTKTYKIYKGCHYSNFIPRIHLLSQVNYLYQRGTIIFDESCKYEIDEASCVNKLFGFCFGFGVHKNSVRFGWTYNAATNQIYIWKYFYIDGELEKEKIFACELEEAHFYEIEVVKDSNLPTRYFITLKIDNEKVVLSKEFKIAGIEYKQDIIYSDKCFITTLGPYFGGNTRAPHTIKIECYGNSGI
jgi:hypothetical protein